MKFVFILISCFFTLVTFSQNRPEVYLGHYKGELQISSGGKTNAVKMEFKLQPTENPAVLDYILIYHSPQKQDVRAYALKQKDTLGNYVLDEKNGITIPTKYINNSLHSFFEVQNSLLKTSLKFSEDYVDFEIVMASVNQTDTTSTYDNNFKVLSYPIQTYQFARLEKQ
jgi:hypothetical protein